MKRKFSEVICKIAQKDGVTPEFVYAEMKKAIRMSFHNLDPAVQAHWNIIAPDGKIPTPEQYIEIISKNIKRDQKRESSLFGSA